MEPLVHFDYRARENQFYLACSEYFSRHLHKAKSQDAHSTSSLIISYIKQANRELI